jgi:hypothetical protein
MAARMDARFMNLPLLLSALCALRSGFLVFDWIA